MDMTEKNGQPSMEEILASIRRIIAEEPADAISLDFKPRSGIEPGNGARHLDIEDASDFELPSMFRASAATSTSEKNSGGPVKLLDALRATPQLDPEFPLPANLNGASDTGQPTPARLDAAAAIGVAYAGIAGSYWTFVLYSHLSIMLPSGLK